MKVFKFGGASVNSVERIHGVGDIVADYLQQPLLIVISAMGKTTNALEKVAEAFYAENKEMSLELFEQIKQQHLTTAKYLLTTGYLACEAQLKDFFTEVEWLLHDKPVREYDYYYDQVVCVGELLSTAIVSHYLNERKINNTWLDVRDIIRTDDNFRDAIIDWEFTAKAVENIKQDLLQDNHIVITQGFIGCTDENESTTLGREGSDYSAAVFANLLDAESQTIWKDVESVMNADPKVFPEVKPLHHLNYREVIEMAFYGAQVIHPKTIKPLQNKNIPLLVKCFLNPALPGTVIDGNGVKELPPIVVLKEKQVLLELTSKDFSFVSEHHTTELFKLFEKFKFKPNLTQNAAIQLHCVVDDFSEKIEALALEASAIFDVGIRKNLSLLTIRHYTGEYYNKITANRTILLKQQSPETIQVLMTEE
jgi:aspartate kinase